MIEREREGHPEGRENNRKIKGKICPKMEEIGLSCECNKKVNFGVFEFQVDCAIPSAQNQKVILEMKINSDTQHVLA